MPSRSPGGEGLVGGLFEWMNIRAVAGRGFRKSATAGGL